MKKLFRIMKFRYLHKKVLSFGERNDANWPEYKSLVIETLLIADQAERGVSRDMAWVGIEYHLGMNRERLLNGGWPVEYYADLMVTVREQTKDFHRLVEVLEGIE